MNPDCTDHEAAESRLSFEEMNLAEPILNAVHKARYETPSTCFRRIRSENHR